MQRKCQGCNKTFTPPNYSTMRCRSCAKGVGYLKKLTEAEIKERAYKKKNKVGKKLVENGNIISLSARRQRTPRAHVMYVEQSFWESIDVVDFAHQNVEK